MKKKKGHVGPTQIKKKIRREEEVAGGRKFIFLFFYFFLSHFSLRFTEIRPSEFVRGRSKVLYSTRATHGNQKHEISPSF